MTVLTQSVLIRCPPTLETALVAENSLVSGDVGVKLEKIFAAR